MAALFGAVLATGLGLLLLQSRFGGWMERTSYNLLHVARGDVRADEALLVYMDEASYDALDQPLNIPWDRSLHARLVDRLSAAGVRVIVFDIVFNDENTNNPAADQSFADAMKRSGRIILAADNVLIDTGMKRVFRPFNLLLDNAAGMGSAETLPDSDTVIRRHTPDDTIPSLSWVAADFLKPGTILPEGGGGITRWTSYYGPPGWLPARSYHRVLDPRQTPDELLRGKAIFIGGKLLTKIAAHRKDEYANPFSFWITRTQAASGVGFFAPGVEVQATKFLNLLRGDWLSRLSSGREHAIVAAVGILFGMGLLRLRPFLATGLALSGTALLAALFLLLFTREHIWFPFLILTLQIGVALAWSIVFNSVQFYVEKRVMEHTLAIYLSPKLVKKFARQPELLRPGALKQNITMFFTDIASFTSLSQGMDSDDLAEFMNRYFQDAVSQCIHKTDGTVVKYIGDAIFAFWNAPEEQADHALRACEAALLFREMGESRMRGHPVRTRIGIHTGEANVGNFGSRDRVDYTALGENVNLASRLEGLNKFVGTETVISRETRDAVGAQLVTRRLGRFRLKGFDSPVEVFELVGRRDLAEATKEWREAFEQALTNYENADFEFAQMGFQRTLELKAGDGPSQFYLGRLEEVVALPAGDWSGETQVFEK